jgi:NAD+ kinase
MYQPGRKVAEDAVADLTRVFKNHSMEDADTIIAVGGDGTAFYAMAGAAGKTVFGLLPPGSNSQGFWMNRVKNPARYLEKRLDTMRRYEITPLKATVRYDDGTTSIHHAFNEVAIKNDNAQAAFLDIKSDHEFGSRKPERLMGDGMYVTTPLGSTGLNHSYGGPVMPLGMPVLTLAALGAFSPRTFNPRLMPNTVKLDIGFVTSAGKRPLHIDMDSFTVRDKPNAKMTGVSIESDPSRTTYLGLARNFPSPYHKLSR